MLFEKKYTAKNGHTIEYVYKPALKDYKHLIFGFNGFAAKNSFPKSFEIVPCDVIWINEADTEACYYLCKNNNFFIADAISEFIKYSLHSLDLTFDNASVTGFSKGGSAALYYGFKLPFKNIVATVPQMNIGSYCHKLHKKNAMIMMGKNYSNIDIEHLDNVIKEQLNVNKTTNRNIYLITSENDEQYDIEIKPYLPYFANLGNFFCLNSLSRYCYKHNVITAHHVPFLLSLYYSFCINISPNFDCQVYNYKGKKLAPIHTYYNLKEIRLDNNLLFLEGIFCLLGYPIIDYKDVSYQLILTDMIDKDRKISFKLGVLHRPKINSEIHSIDYRHFVTYDKAYFSTIHRRGIDISDIPRGTYKLEMSIKLNLYNNVEKIIPLTHQEHICLTWDNFSVTNSQERDDLFLIVN